MSNYSPEVDEDIYLDHCEICRLNRDGWPTEGEDK